ncbi:MAG: hypothetical protein RIA62_01955 [Cyclobacteriaceae bacterium]
MKRNLVLLAISAVILFSCDNNEIGPTEFAFKNFTIELPSNWSINEVQGYDSYVSQIKTSNNQIINIDLGPYSSDLPVDTQTHDITHQIIDNKEAKVVSPKNFQSGITGVYFNNLDNQGTKLQLSGSDLSKSNQRLFLTAIETIKFR